jgi:hypothetical protein
MGRAFGVLQLIAALESLYESFLSEVLSVRGVAYNPVDQQEYTAEILIDEPGLLLLEQG